MRGNTIAAAALLENAQQPLIIATHRRFAAIVALVFPTVAAAYVIFVMSKVGMAEFLSHRMAKASILPSIVALGIWIVRYWRPAIITFTLKENPIEISRDVVKFFGSAVPLSQNPVFHVNASNVSVISDGGMECSERKFFVKSKVLGIN